jgi:hypothetical protein
MSRKRKSKRENKRLDSKKARAAEKAALEGGHAKVVRSEKWTVKDDRQPPLMDDAPSGKPQRKKKSKKEIKYCLARQHLGEGKKRHYFIEREIEITPYEWEVDPQPRFSLEKRCMYCDVRRVRGGWGRWRWGRLV